MDTRTQDEQKLVEMFKKLDGTFQQSVLMKLRDVISPSETTREKALRDTFDEMIQTIRNYMVVSPMCFLDGDQAQPGEYVFEQGDYRFSNFEGWNERWMGVLYPRTLQYQESMKAKDIGDDERFFHSDLQRFGFVLGYLVGCSSMGASREQLLDKANAYIVNELAITHYLNESEQGKE